MHEYSDELSKREQAIAAHKQNCATGLEQERLKLQQRLLTIDEKLQSINTMAERLLRFRPVIGSDYQSPNCFIKTEAKTTLTAKQGSRTHDVFTCKTCHVEFNFLAP